MRKRKRRTERFLWPRAGAYDKDIRRSSIVQVDWKDATSMSKWEDNDHEPGLSLCSTTGFLLRRAPGHISIAASLSVQNHHGDAISIPRGMIQRIKVLQRAPADPVERKGHKK
jgi:hypothetical protein